MLLNHYSKLLVISYNTTKIPLISNRYSTISFFPPNKTKATPTVTIPLPHLYPPMVPRPYAVNTEHTAHCPHLDRAGCKGGQRLAKCYSSIPMASILDFLLFKATGLKPWGWESCYTNFNLQGMEILKTSFNYYYSQSLNTI